MKILEIRVLRGPNYWSGYRKELIDMRVDLGDYENFPTNTIEGFGERLEKALPGLRDHECSKKKLNGFLERVKEGTWLGHVIEHVALELQCRAGMPCGYGRTRSAPVKGVYHVVFSYLIESAGLYAAKAAVRLVQALAEKKEYDPSADIRELNAINVNEGFGPSAKAILHEAKKRDIPFRRLDRHSYILLGQGKHQKIIRSTLSSDTSIIGVELAGDKELTKQILSQLKIPVPRGTRISEPGELSNAIDGIGFPIVIKPHNGNHGRGVTTRITDHEEAGLAFDRAKKISSQVIVERFIDGDDYRLLVVNYRLVAAAKRIPALITGDGASTIEELIRQVNDDPNRGEEHEKILTTIKVDENTLSILQQNNLGLGSVLPEGQVLVLKNTANLSTGGTARDVTHLVHPLNVAMAERIARITNLNICGIDIIAQDIAVPLTGANGAVLEVNAAPGLRMHLSPTTGLPQNVAEPIVSMLYPPGAPSRIPIVAVTGTNGKTTTTRLIAYLAKQAGHSVGYATTDGVFVGNEQIEKGDCSGPASAAMVLRDPLVDFAVLECARGGILRSGLGFDKCSTSILTNISEDHLGLDDIDSIDKLARVKAVVINSTSNDGYAILNADDDIVYGMRDELSCNIALFSLSASNERIKAHCATGGLAAIVEKGYFTICKGNWRTRLLKVRETPLTFEGRAGCMIKNVLPAILAAVVHNFDMEQLRRSLLSFKPSTEFTPGRMNIFEFPGYRLMVDYAHNRDGLSDLQKFLEQMPAIRKVGIIACPGDRRDQDIRNVGECAARMFDEIIIKHDKDGRGRTNDEITNLFREGISTINSAIPVRVISDELEAVQYAMDTAVDDSFIVVCTEKVQDVLDYVSARQRASEVPA